jgi:hypothetical protein
MDAYKYDHSPHRHRIRYSLIVLLSTAAVVWGLIATVSLVNAHKSHTVVPGGTVLVPQTNTAAPMITINEPLFTMRLPSDWKQIAVQPHSVTWQAGIKGADNRWLTIYTDVLPTTLPVNRELPITVNGNQLSYGELSDNCANFTPGGTLNVAQAALLKPTVSVWQGVNFICSLNQVVDNQVGTGSSAGINTITVTGPTDGTHNYFFLYIDRNIQPDYTIFYGAIQSFRAK